MAQVRGSRAALAALTLAGMFFAAAELSAGVDDPIGLDHSPEVGRGGVPLSEHELLEQIKEKIFVPLGALSTEVDVNGDGVPDMVVRSWRHGGVTPRAHVYYDFFIRREDSHGVWEFYSAKVYPPMGRTVPRGYGDIECMWSDVRFLVAKPGSGEGPTLVLANRQMGEDHYSPGEVTFRFYRLQNYAQIGGYAYFFVEDGEIVAKDRYCDVGEAFEKELGLVQPRDTLFPSGK